MPLFAKRLLPPEERGDRKDREEAGGDSCRCGPGPGEAGGHRMLGWGLHFPSPTPSAEPLAALDRIATRGQISLRNGFSFKF